MVVKLFSWAVPSKSTQVFSHPYASQHHRQNTKNLDGANTHNKDERRTQVIAVRGRSHSSRREISSSVLSTQCSETAEETRLRRSHMQMTSQIYPLWGWLGNPLWSSVNDSIYFPRWCECFSIFGTLRTFSNKICYLFFWKGYFQIPFFLHRTNYSTHSPLVTVMLLKIKLGICWKIHWELSDEFRLFLSNQKTVVALRTFDTMIYVFGDEAIGGHFQIWRG